VPAYWSFEKRVYAWAVEGDLDESKIVSNTFTLEWPPQSGLVKQYPEVDKGAWFPPEIAIQKIHTGQIPLVDELMKNLNITIQNVNNLDKNGQFNLF